MKKCSCKEPGKVKRVVLGEGTVNKFVGLNSCAEWDSDDEANSLQSFQPEFFRLSGKRVRLVAELM